MNRGLAVALVVGAGNFVAKNLVEKLLEKDILVVVLGDFFDNEFIKNKNLEFVENLADFKEGIEYVFDFGGEEDVWLRAKEDGARLVLVGVDSEGNIDKLVEKLKEEEINWRLIKGYGVYGRSMDVKNNEIGKLVMSAVKNEVLKLPEDGMRLLNVNDFVEAVLRCCFLSETEGERFVIVGDKLGSIEIAEILMDGAKMTERKYELIEGLRDMRYMEDHVERDFGKIEESCNRLRWKAKIEFKEGMEEVLQYVFALVDEEARKVKSRKMEVKSEEERRQKREKERRIPKYEVEIEGETEKIEELDVVEESPLLHEAMEGQGHIELKNEDVARQKEELIKNYELRIKNEKLRIKDKKEKKEDVTVEDFKIKRSGLRKVKESGFAGDNLEKEEPTSPGVMSSQSLPSLEAPTFTKVTAGKLARQGENNVADNNREKCGKKKKGGWKWLLLVVVLGLLVPIITLITIWSVDVYKSIKSVFEIKELVAEREWDKAEEEVKYSLGKIRGVYFRMNSLGVNKLVWMEKVNLSMRLLENVLELERELVLLAKNGESMMATVFGDGEFDWLGGLIEFEELLKKVESQAGLLEARLEGGWNWLPAKWRSWPQKGAEEISETRKLVGKVRKALPVLNEFLGIDGKRRDYLVLFQNEMEIRATGGFIGSYGVISFQDGRLLNLEVKDIYGIDGQLKGHVEPPKQIKEILGEASWYMRDANWQADFTASAEDIKWFFKKEAGRDVDGVIGVNLAVAKEALLVAGEVYVPDFKENVNADNLYDQAEFYSENNFFAGSTQKESFLGLLTKQLFEEIKGLKAEKKLNFLKAMIKSLDENEIQVAVDNKEMAKKMADLGWDGSIYDGKCAIDDCLADYLFLVESNLGVNKANYFLYRNIDQVIDIGNKSVSRIVRIAYENTAKSKAWPGGDYKNYMRIYLPKDVKISGLSIYDSDNPNSKKIFEIDKLDIRLVNGKKEVGFLVVVPIDKKRTVEIRYLTKVNLEEKDNFSYLNYVQKQSGYGDTRIVSLVSFPDDWQPLQVQPAATLVGGKLLFNQKLSSDLKMGVEISK